MLMYTYTEAASKPSPYSPSSSDKAGLIRKLSTEASVKNFTVAPGNTFWSVRPSIA